MGIESVASYWRQKNILGAGADACGSEGEIVETRSIIAEGV